MDDAELARRAQAGDSAAWAEIYDTYAERLHDYCWSILRDRHEAEDALHDAFVTAAGKIDQLRDPARLRSWLYAVCRTSALARTRQRARVVPSEDVTDVTVEIGDEPGVETAELQRIVWAAAEGLAPRDRAVLELHLRHGLAGQELADALGVSPHHATVLLSRVRELVERSLGALLVGRTGRRDCPDLDALLTDWDGTLSPLLRKRVARHIERCEVCGERRRRTVSPLALLGAMPLLGPRPELRDQVLADVTRISSTRSVGDGRSASRWAGRRRTLGAAAAVALLVAAAALVWPDHEAARLEAGRSATTDATATTGVTTVTASAPTPPPSTTTTTAPPVVPVPVVIAVVSGPVDFGLDGTSATAVVRNDGAQAVAWTAAGHLPGLAVTPASGTLAAGATTELALTLDRAALGEGDHDGTVVLSGRGVATGEAAVERSLPVSARVERAPLVTDLTTDRTTITFGSGSPCPTAQASATVIDESAVTVVLSWRKATSSAAEEVPMAAFPGGRYTATIGPVLSPSDGPVTWWVTATDARGNVARSPDRSLAVGGSC